MHLCVTGIYERIYVPADLLSCAGRDGTGLFVSSWLLRPLAQWRTFTPALAQFQHGDPNLRTPTNLFHSMPNCERTNGLLLGVGTMYASPAFAIHA